MDDPNWCVAIVFIVVLVLYVLLHPVWKYTVKPLLRNWKMNKNINMKGTTTGRFDSSRPNDSNGPKK
jgi:hypothetical protein